MEARQKAQTKVGLVQYIADRFDLNVEAVAELVDEHPQVLEIGGLDFELMLGVLAETVLLEGVRGRAKRKQVVKDVEARPETPFRPAKVKPGPVHAGRHSPRGGQPMSKHGPKETLLRASALEIAKREGITIEAAMQAASAVDMELSEAARCERLEQPTPQSESNAGDAHLTAELMDRTQEHQRMLGVSFADAYAKACEESAHRITSNAVATSIFISLGTARARERDIELGVALDQLRVETPRLWQQAIGARR